VVAAEIGEVRSEPDTPEPLVPKVEVGGTAEFEEVEDSPF
jgi:hypothetical protein